jgi:hypothetical protein
LAGAQDSVDELDVDTDVFFVPSGANDGADRAGHTATLSDYSAHVAITNGDVEAVAAITVGQLHVDRIGVINDLLDDIFTNGLCCFA